jgi:gluconolactonase
MHKFFQPRAYFRSGSQFAISLLLLLASVNTFAQVSETAGTKEIAHGLRFPEGTVFVAGTLYFVDYGESQVLRIDQGRVDVVWQRDGCGANGLVQNANTLLVACYDENAIVEISTDGRTVNSVNADVRGEPLIHPNDLTGDQHGGVYFTASGSADTPGKIYYRDAAHRVREVATGLDYANGVAVSPDGKTLYVAESDAARILAFTIRMPGSLENRRVFATQAAPAGRSVAERFTPDGVRTDAQGNVFVAEYNGGGIVVFDSNGQQRATARLPGTHHSNLAISPDGKSIVVTAIENSVNSEYQGKLLQIQNPIVQQYESGH